MMPSIFNRGDLQNIANNVEDLIISKVDEETRKAVLNLICDYNRPRPNVFDVFSFLVNAGGFYDGGYQVWVSITDCQGLRFCYKVIKNKTEKDEIVDEIKAECVTYLETIQDDIGEITKEKIKLVQDFSKEIAGTDAIHLNITPPV
jgi:hypothetical protein